MVVLFLRFDSWTTVGGEGLVWPASDDGAGLRSVLLPRTSLAAAAPGSAHCFCPGLRSLLRSLLRPGL